MGTRGGFMILGVGIFELGDLVYVGSIYLLGATNPRSTRFKQEDHSLLILIQTNKQLNLFFAPDTPM